MMLCSTTSEAPLPLMVMLGSSGRSGSHSAADVPAGHERAVPDADVAEFCGGAGVSIAGVVRGGVGSRDRDAAPGHEHPVEHEAAAGLPAHAERVRLVDPVVEQPQTSGRHRSAARSCRLSPAIRSKPSRSS